MSLNMSYRNIEELGVVAEVAVENGHSYGHRLLVHTDYALDGTATGYFEELGFVSFERECYSDLSPYPFVVLNYRNTIRQRGCDFTVYIHDSGLLNSIAEASGARAVGQAHSTALRRLDGGWLRQNVERFLLWEGAQDRNPWNGNCGMFRTIPLAAEAVPKQKPLGFVLHSGIGPKGCQTPRSCTERTYPEESGSQTLQHKLCLSPTWQLFLNWVKSVRITERNGVSWTESANTTRSFEDTLETCHTPRKSESYFIPCNNDIRTGKGGEGPGYTWGHDNATLSSTNLLGRRGMQYQEKSVQYRKLETSNFGQSHRYDYLSLARQYNSINLMNGASSVRTILQSYRLRDAPR
jgi:hypothetical protein